LEDDMALPDPEEALAKARGTEEDEELELLPAQTTIEIDVKDGRGKRYKGTFLYHVPNIGTLIDIGNMKTQYLPQGSAADVNAVALVEVVCYLTAAIQFNDSFKKPKWWDPLKAYSMEPYTRLYGRCLEYEARFHGTSEEPRDDESGLREGDNDGEVRGGSEVRVGDEVRPTSKRRETLAGDGA
jgi:hypothetical protein